ncbi:M14 family metallopeptidase [Sphingomonas baiyangensis]|uniref:Carboxypeptidase n=1 Tax=Sphingomonas baiyangensis TaxID=2572576 RepID=A0A4U1L9Q6_9SPHN|nr:M14 family metallopeptidase [Sphingomonas baiyangensis]TKD53313.1 carboxypeptidase [Sphingomonas baiyangensis]
MFKLLVAALGLVAAMPAVAQQMPTPPELLPPVPPWSGASGRLIARANDRWITPAERADFATTPDHAETRGWLERLAAASPRISIETFGKSGQGRDLIAVRASSGGAPKPVVLVQAGIHAGEIDGKDAGLMLLRDIAFGGKAGLLDKVDLVFVPILNVDGHERASVWNFPHVRGPANKGTVGNARGLNLNRDYAKLDAPETQAVVALLRRLDPILYIDCHVSGGFDMGYDITFTYAGWGRYAYHRQTADWLMQRFGPAVTTALEAAGHAPTIYPSPIDTRHPSAGIRQAPEGPRYSTGYGDFIGVPTVLVENHMLKPYRQRVLGTYVLLEAALKLAGAEAGRIAEAKAADRASRPETLLTRWRPAREPIGWVKDFKGIAFDPVRSPATARAEQRWTGRPATWRMPIIGQVPVERIAIARAWWIPPEQQETIDRLRRHGIQMTLIDEPRTVDLDHVRLVGPELAAPYEGRVPLRSRFAHARLPATLPAGSVRVAFDQPLGLLAAALLEPESQDSFLAWGFYPEMLMPPPGSEAFVLAPLADALLATDPDVREAFEAKLSSDPAFAADGDARLAWFAARLPELQSRHLLYPVLREP